MGFPAGPQKRGSGHPSLYPRGVMPGSWLGGLQVLRTVVVVMGRGVERKEEGSLGIWLIIRASLCSSGVLSAVDPESERQPWDSSRVEKLSPKWRVKSGLS